MWQDVCSLFHGWIRLGFLTEIGLEGGQSGGGSTEAAWTNGACLLYDRLDVTSMGVCGHLFFTGRAFAVPTFVSLDGLETMAQHLAVGATLVGAAHRCLLDGRYTARTGMRLVVQEAVGAEKEVLAVSA